MLGSRFGRWPRPVRRDTQTTPPPEPPPTEPVNTTATVKTAALQHGTVNWRSDSTKQAVIAKYDMLLTNFYPGLSGVAAGLDAIRTLNTDIYITQYLQAWETRVKGIYSITNVSGTTYQVTLDGVDEGANSGMVNNNLANGVTAYIRQAGAFDGDYVVSGLTTVGNRRAFNITAAAGIANQTGLSSRGCMIESSDAMAPRSLLVMERDWMLRNTSGRIRSSGVDDATRGVNLHDTVTPDSEGKQWPQRLPLWDKPNIIDPYQPTVLNTKTGRGIDGFFIDNWNWRPRTSSGVWGSTKNGPVSGGAISQDDPILQTRCRNANRYFIETTRGLNPDADIIGNADNDLNYPEWPSGTLEGSFIESIGNSWMFDLTDKGAAIQDTLRSQKAKCSKPGLHIVHVKGTGATSADQQADYTTFIRGLCVMLMQGEMRADLSYYAFTPSTHDVTAGGNVWHDEYDAQLGDPLDGAQTAGRAASGWIWVRYFQGGVVVWNSHPTLAQSVDVRTVPGNPGKNYKRITGTTNPFNTGAKVTGSISIPAKGGAIFLVDNAAGPANTKYVRQGATGTGSGDDWTNAYTTLPSTLTRGYTYYIADGTYSGYNFDDAASGTTLITIKKATEDDHGISTGWNSTYGDGQAVFNGAWTFSTRYWLVDGQTGGGAVNNWGGNFGFKLNVASGRCLFVTTTGGDVTCRHLHFYGGGLPGNATNNDGCEIRGPNFTLSYYRMENLGKSPFWLGGSNLIIEHGWVSEFAFGGSSHCEIASIWDIGSTFGDVTFRYNLFTHLDSTGGIMWDNHVNRSAVCRVHGNIWYQPPGATWSAPNNGCVGGWSGGNAEECHNLKVFGNCFVDINKTDQITMGNFPNINSGCEARNNLFYNCNSPAFDIYSHDHNHFINSGGAHSEANGTSAASGNPFVDKAGLDFRLVAATAAGNSTIGATYSTDPLGNTRGADGTWDRGAFEYVASGGTDVTPPTITGRSPAASATDIAIASAVTVTFSEPMTASTINGTTFTLVDDASSAVAGTVTYDSGTRTATFTPSASLSNSKVYTAKVMGGSSGVKDLAGNALAADSSWSFTTVAAGSGGGAGVPITYSAVTADATPFRMASPVGGSAVNVAVGDVVLVLAAWEGVDHDPGTVTITNSGVAQTWVSIGNVARTTAGSPRLAAWYCKVNTAQSQAPTLSWTAAGNMQLSIQQIVLKNVDPADPIPSANVFTGTNAASASKAITPSISGSALWLFSSNGGTTGTTTYAAGANCTIASNELTDTFDSIVLRPTTQPRADTNPFTLSETHTGTLVNWIAFEVKAVPA